MFFSWVLFEGSPGFFLLFLGVLLVFPSFFFLVFWFFVNCFSLFFSWDIRVVHVPSASFLPLG